MYLYQPGRKPSRQFRYDIMMFGPDPHGEPMALQLALTTDECSHPRRAVDVVGRIMCSESVPMVNATAIVVANRTGTGPQQIYLGMTNNDGTYRETAFIGYGTRGYEVLDMVLMFVNTCGDKVGQRHMRKCRKMGRRKAPQLFFLKTWKYHARQEALHCQCQRNFEAKIGQT